METSELWGFCSVGNSDPWALLEFVLLPKAILEISGMFFVSAGFNSIFHEQKIFKRRVYAYNYNNIDILIDKYLQGIDTTKLVKFMVKMGLFSIIHSVVVLVTLICELFQFVDLLQWYPSNASCKQLKTYGNISSDTICTRPQQPQACGNFYNE